MIWKSGGNLTVADTKVETTKMEVGGCCPNFVPSANHSPKFFHAA